MGWGCYIARLIIELYANVRSWWEILVYFPFYLSGRSLVQIPWKFLQTSRRCGEFLVSANPLTFNGICSDKAFPMEFLQTSRKCGEFLVSANPLTFNGFVSTKLFLWETILFLHFPGLAFSFVGLFIL